MGFLDIFFGTKLPVCTLSEADRWAVTHFAETKRSTASRVVRLLVEQTGLPLADFTAASRFIEDMQLVDLDSVELVMAVEEEFAMDIPGADAERLNTVTDLVDYLHTRLESPMEH